MSNFLGYEGFVWFIATVEDVNDPLKLGRVRIRVNNVHTQDTGLLPTEELPWAIPIQDITSAGIQEKGRSPTGILVGTTVVGFFADGKAAQHPLVMGTFAANPSYPADNEHEVNQLARETNKISKTPDSTISEPSSPYNAQYPKNHVYESESGHTIEIDDTPSAERIHIYHKSGTFVEIHPNGDVVTQHKNGWRSVTGNDKLHVTGNMDVYVDGNVNWTIGGNLTETVSGSQTTQVTGNIDIDGARIDLN